MAGKEGAVETEAGGSGWTGPGREGAPTTGAGWRVRVAGLTVVVGLATGAAWTGAGSTAGAATRAGPPQVADARARVERAYELMGGPALDALERVRLDMMTQWQRPSFREVPWTDRPSFESHVDVRDYTIPAWRNTRDFGSRLLVNVVRDSVAVTHFQGESRPQSVAYVDERNELFAYTPDRLVLLLRRAADLRGAGDTLLGGERHHRVRATLPTLGGPLPATVAFHAGTGLPTMLRFRKGHPNDFGLVPYGDMRVEVWYSNWRTFGEISIPTQWDIQRAGVPYKRMTVRSAAFDPDFAPDSFRVAPPMRAAYLDAVGPMHDRPVDSTVVRAPGVVEVVGFGPPAGAVRLGDRWALLEAGHHPLLLERARAALREHGVDDLAAALVYAARAGNGGVAALVREGVPVYTSAAAEPFLDAVLEGAGVERRGITVVRRGRWLELGGERLRLEPVDLPDVPGSLMVYDPERRWLYARDVSDALDARVVLDRARELGWTVSSLGTARGLWTAAPGPESEG